MSFILAMKLEIVNATGRRTERTSSWKCSDLNRTCRDYLGCYNSICNSSSGWSCIRTKLYEFYIVMCQQDGSASQLPCYKYLNVLDDSTLRRPRARDMSRVREGLRCRETPWLLVLLRVGGVRWGRSVCKPTYSEQGPPSFGILSPARRLEGGG